VYDSDIQRRLLGHAATSLAFSQRGVDRNLVAWNKVVLLHGPPGTGKTSLCQALAHKLSIRLSQWCAAIRSPGRVHPRESELLARCRLPVHPHNCACAPLVSKDDDCTSVSWCILSPEHGWTYHAIISAMYAMHYIQTSRQMCRFRMGHLIEVNAHSLFSKYFSESGKLVSKLFGKIMDIVDDPSELTFVLIDEVESLTAARKAAVSGNEPSDAIRAVNSLLTHLDALRRHPNVMVLCTSNLPEAMDVAFIDRADIKVHRGLTPPINCLVTLLHFQDSGPPISSGTRFSFFQGTRISLWGAPKLEHQVNKVNDLQAYVGPPGLSARYQILHSCVTELQRTGIVDDHSPPLSWDALQECTQSRVPPGDNVDSICVPVVSSNVSATIENGCLLRYDPLPERSLPLVDCA
jgi:hypothetical protein